MTAGAFSTARRTALRIHTSSRCSATRWCKDWDLDGDGTPEALRLGFVTSKGWLEDSKGYKVERPPTAFGPVSLNVKSKLAQDELIAKLQLPERNPPKTILVRARVPGGWKIVSAQISETS